MKTKILLIISAILMMLISCSSIPEKKRNTKNELEHLIQTTMEQAGVTGLAVSVINDGEIILSRGFGFSDGKEAQRPVTKDTLFQIGSITKIITAIAIMDLVEEGIIELDKDIRFYLKEFKPKTDFVENSTITVRNLLTHHSGLPSSYLKDFTLDNPDSEYFMKTSSLLSEEYMVWKSDKVWAYNNAGFSLLGELIGTVSGLSYVQYIDQRIFQPIGIKDALVYLADRNDTSVSGGFTDGEPEDLLFIRDIPAGSILLSAENMSLFMKELLDCSQGKSQKILKTETLRSMFVQQNNQIPLDDTFKIGLTFWIDSINGKKTVGHGGTIPPFYSEMKLMPENGLGIFLNSNDNLGDNLLLHHLERKIFNILTETTEMKIADTEFNASAEIDIRRVEGYYTCGAFGLFQILAKDSVLMAEFPEMGMSSLISIQPDNSLLIEDLGIRLIKSDIIEADFFCYMDDYFLGPIISITHDPASPLWKKRAGRYLSDDFFDALTLSYNKGAQSMVMELEESGGHTPLALTVKSDSLLQVQGYGRTQGNIVEYYEEGSISYIKFAGITFIKQN